MPNLPLIAGQISQFDLKMLILIRSYWLCPMRPQIVL